MQNPFTKQKNVSAVFIKLTADTMKETVPIDPTQPGYFSHRLFMEPTYDPQKDGVGAVEGTNYVKITDISSSAVRKEVAFLDQLGLIVTTGDGTHYMSPLAAIFYGAAGLFGQDLEMKLSTLDTSEQRLEFLKPVFGLFANYVLPGRIMRARLVRGTLPDTVYEGERLKTEIHEMQAMLNQIMSLI
jgi:hypothetical protein